MENNEIYPKIQVQLFGPVQFPFPEQLFLSKQSNSVQSSPL